MPLVTESLPCHGRYCAGKRWRPSPDHDRFVTGVVPVRPRLALLPIPDGSEGRWVQLVTAIRIPYGAMELKRVYQRHMLIGTGTAAILTALGLLFAWFYTLWADEDVRILNPLAGNPQDSMMILTIGPPPMEYDRPKTAEPESSTGISDSPTLRDDEGRAAAGRLTVWGSPAIPGPDGKRLGLGQAPAWDMFYPVEIPPVMINEVLPEYPSAAREEGFNGIVTLHVYIDQHGVVRKVQVAACTPPAKGFEEAAMKAAYLGKYLPGFQNGIPVGVWISYKVRFQLEEEISAEGRAVPRLLADGLNYSHIVRFRTGRGGE